MFGCPPNRGNFTATLPCVGAHHLARKLTGFGHDARLMPAKYVRPYAKGQKNDFNDAEAIVEAVQRPTMKFVATKTADQLDLQALHRVRERLVSQRTGIINQIRAFMLERGIAVRQGIRFLRAELPISHFYKTRLRPTLKRIDAYVIRWARRKFKRMRHQTKGARDWFDRLRRATPKLFAHWPLCHGNGRTSGAV